MKLLVEIDVDVIDRDEFRDYLDKIIRWASIHFQILIPDPNQDEDQYLL